MFSPVQRKHNDSRNTTSNEINDLMQRGVGRFHSLRGHSTLFPRPTPRPFSQTYPYLGTNSRKVFGGFYRSGFRTVGCRRGDRRGTIPLPFATPRPAGWLRRCRISASADAAAELAAGVWDVGLAPVLSAMTVAAPMPGVQLRCGPGGGALRQGGWGSGNCRRRWTGRFAAAPVHPRTLRLKNLGRPTDVAARSSVSVIRNCRASFLKSAGSDCGVRHRDLARALRSLIRRRRSSVAQSAGLSSGAAAGDGTDG